MPLLLFVFCFTFGLLALFLLFQLLSRLELLIMYFTVWTPEERRSYCPQGILRAIIFDE